MKKQIVVTLLILFFCLPNFAQQFVKQKIDPAFVSLILKQKVRDSSAYRTCLSPPRVKESGGIASGNKAVEKKYECIVFTKNAKALRDKGITIHSELATFVTAWASLQQIKLMSLMPEVSYIEAPQINNLH